MQRKAQIGFFTELSAKGCFDRWKRASTGQARGEGLRSAAGWKKPPSGRFPPGASLGI
jgi:hypothetical protein